MNGGQAPPQLYRPSPSEQQMLIQQQQQQQQQRLPRPPEEHPPHPGQHQGHPMLPRNMNNQMPPQVFPKPHERLSPRLPMPQDYQNAHVKPQPQVPQPMPSDLPPPPMLPPKSEHTPPPPPLTDPLMGSRGSDDSIQ